MSVSRAASEDELTSYNNIVPQQLSRVFRIDIGNSSSTTNGTWQFNQENSIYTPVGENFWNDLDRQKQYVAELVVFRLDTAVAWMRNNAQSSSEGNLETETAISLNPGAPGDQVQVDDSTIEGWTPSGGPSSTNLEAKLAASNRQGHRRLYETILIPTQDWDDSTTGTGGGSDTDRVQPFTMNYREHFGRGPLVDDGDDITIRNDIRAFDVDNKDMLIYVQCQLYWDIWEAERGSFTDSPVSGR